MARLQLLFVVALIAIALHAIDAKYSDSMAIHGKDPRCHHPYLLYECQSSHYQHENYTITGWFYFHLYKSCHPMYSLGGVHHCKINEDVPKSKKECEDLCAEPCKMNNGTAGICMFEKYCTNYSNTYTTTRTQCKADGVRCCLPESVPVTEEEHPTTTTIIIPASKKDVVSKPIGP